MPITVSGTSITFNDSTTQTTAATGTVSSVATGNGLQGGTITTSGTLSVACPTFNTVGSYSGCVDDCVATLGSNYGGRVSFNRDSTCEYTGVNLSGTWKRMGYCSNSISLYCRVS